MEFSNEIYKNIKMNIFFVICHILNFKKLNVGRNLSPHGYVHSSGKEGMHRVL
jgi:hypothetical protein